MSLYAGQTSIRLQKLMNFEKKFGTKKIKFEIQKRLVLNFSSYTGLVTAQRFCQNPVSSLYAVIYTTIKTQKINFIYTCT